MTWMEWYNGLVKPSWTPSTATILQLSITWLNWN